MRNPVSAMVGVVAIILVVVACGDGAAPPPGGNQTSAGEDEISRMLLQEEDVPPELLRVDADGRIENVGDSGIQAGLISFLFKAEEDGAQVRFSEFELPPEHESAGETICITSLAVITESQEKAELALFNTAELIGTSEDVPVVREGDAEIELLDSAWRFRSTSEDLCESYQNQPAEGCILPLTEQNVVGIVFVASSQTGADCEGAAGLAQKQSDRIQATLAAD